MILAPDNLGKSWSRNCWPMVHGIRSPDDLWPLESPCMMDELEISPSRATWIAQNTS